MQNQTPQIKPVLKFEIEGWDRDHQWTKVTVDAKNETKARIIARQLGVNVKKIRIINAA